MNILPDNHIVNLFYKFGKLNDIWFEWLLIDDIQIKINKLNSSDYEI